MTATSLIDVWVLAATGLLFLLIFVGTGYRLYRRRRRLYYKRLGRINHIVGWSRIIFVALGLVAAVRVASRGPDYQTVLIAPCAWAIVVLLGVICTDFFLFGNSRYSSFDKPKVRISVCLPWTLILLLLLLLAIEWTGSNWGRDAASIDQRSHVYSWVVEGTFGWGLKTPFPGTFYTIPLLYCVPAVMAVGLCGILLVLIRRAWLPAAKYAALDEGFRARTIRDIVLICVGAVSPTLSMMGFDVAWAFGTLGPGSSDRALVVAIAFFIGAWNLGQTFWVLANLIFLPPVAENRRLAEQIRAAANRKIESVTIPESEFIEFEAPEIVEPRAEVTEIEVVGREMLEIEAAETEAIQAEVTKAEEIEAEVTEAEAAEAVEAEIQAVEAEIEVAESEGAEAEQAETEQTEIGQAEVEQAEAEQAEAGQTEVEQAEPVKTEAELAEIVEAELATSEAELAEIEAEFEVEAVPIVSNTSSKELVVVGTSQHAEPNEPNEPNEPIKHIPVKPGATHRPGFKPKKKKPRRR